MVKMVTMLFCPLGTEVIYATVLLKLEKHKMFSKKSLEKRECFASRGKSQWHYQSGQKKVQY